MYGDKFSTELSFHINAPELLLADNLVIGQTSLLLPVIPMQSNVSIFCVNGDSSSDTDTVMKSFAFHSPLRFRVWQYKL